MKQPRRLADAEQRMLCVMWYSLWASHHAPTSVLAWAFISLPCGDPMHVACEVLCIGCGVPQHNGRNTIL